MPNKPRSKAKAARPTTVAAYLASLTPEKRAVMEEARAFVHRHIPMGYAEFMNWGVINWGIPLEEFSNTHNGQPLCYVGLGAQKNYNSLYLMGVYDSSNGKYTTPFSEKLLVDAFKKAGKRLDMGKCCLHFKALDDLELASVAKVIAMSTPKEYIAYYKRMKGLGMRKHILAGALAGLLTVHGSASAQAGRAFTTDFTTQEFAARRAKVYDAIGQDAIALMQGLPSVHSSAVFRQSNEFYYLTGVVAPQALVLLDGAARRTILYLPKQDARRAATEGDLLSSDDPIKTASITGVDEVRPTDQLLADLTARSVKIVYVPYAPSEGASESPDGARRRTVDAATDPWDGRISREDHLRGLLKTRAPTLEQRDLSPILNRMREIKSPAEIAIINRATKIGGEAIIEAMRSTVPGLTEQELDAVGQFIFIRHGAQGEAYRAIVASGPVATNPHHRAGPKVMVDGELVLMDYCPDLGYYRCDITRQWPVNGKFTPAQRELYGFYLGVYEAVLYSIKPNITAQDIVKAALPKMDMVLTTTKFSKQIYEKAAKEYVERYRRMLNPDTTGGNRGRGANLGHAVGMATHDFGGGSGVMRPGLVFTIEPEFRVPEEQIYIRLEDMIVITESGAQITSDFVPRSIAAVEKTIAESGLLQKYGRIK